MSSPTSELMTAPLDVGAVGATPLAVAGPELVVADAGRVDPTVGGDVELTSGVLDVGLDTELGTGAPLLKTDPEEHAAPKTSSV